jgi:DNA-binding LacI/PurR family transcriptional regulator
VPAAEMGATAVRFLIERIAAPDAPPRQELFAPPISLRGSTGPLSAAR